MGVFCVLGCSNFRYIVSVVEVLTIFLDLVQTNKQKQKTPHKSLWRETNQSVEGQHLILSEEKNEIRPPW